MPLYAVYNANNEVLFKGTITDCTIFKKSMKDDTLIIKRYSLK